MDGSDCHIDHFHLGTNSPDNSDNRDDRYTANTMASAIEALGMSLPYSSSVPAWDPLTNSLHPDKIAETGLAAEAVINCMKKGILPRDVMTKESFENAVRIVMVTGGSTNASIHLIAMARSAGLITPS